MVKIGTILVHSIGFGCDEFWQVVKATEKTITARKLNYKVVNRNIKCQSCDIVPVKNSFAPPNMRFRNSKTKAGFVKYDENIITLRVSQDGKIGPSERLMWWNVWKGKKQNQYSS